MRYTRVSFTPSLTTLLLGLVLLATFALPLVSGDLGWHMRVGHLVLERAEIPRLNVLTWTAAWHPWLTHEWLSGVLFAALYDAGGLGGLMVARALLFLAPLLVLYRMGRRIDAEPLLLAGLLLLTAVSLSLHVTLRPWTLSNLLLAIELAWIDAARRPGRAPLFWAIPPLLALWIDLHGGFAVGLALFALSLLHWSLHVDPGMETPRRLRRLGSSLTLLTVTLVLLLLNPHHGEALVLPLRYLLADETSGLAMMGEIKEWGPIDLGSFFGGVYLVWVGLALAVLVRGRGLRRRPAFLLGLVFLGLTFQARRHLPIAALLLFPGVCEGLLAPVNRWLEAIRQAGNGSRWRFLAGLSAQEAVPRGPFLALLLAAITLWGGISSLGPAFETGQLKAQGYPMEAVRALSALPPGHLFNHYDWAGILAWQAPDRPLFITPANDAYPRELFADWLTIANLKPGWEERLEAWKVDTVLMPAGSALVEALEARGWQVRFKDDVAALLTLPPGGPLEETRP